MTTLHLEMLICNEKVEWSLNFFMAVKGAGV